MKKFLKPLSKEQNIDLELEGVADSKTLAEIELQDNSMLALQEVRTFFLDKILSEFPIFALNDDYIKAITKVVFNKVK